MIRYTGTRDEDHRILRWYADLVTTGELETTFVEALHPVGAFFGYFRSGTLLYEPDDSGRFAFCAWAMPFLSGFFFGVYVQPRFRRSKIALRWVEAAVTLMLQARPVVLAMTRRPRNAKMYVAFGCRLLAKVPHLSDGQAVYVLMLTRELYMARRATAQGRLRRRVTQEVIA